MPKIASNRFYNDPALGAAFGSLAAIFQPPSGSDLHGYASAADQRLKSKTLADLLGGTNDPDRQATYLGIYNPTQSWTEQAANDERVRYGVDVGARTELEKQRIADAATGARQDTINQTNVTKKMLDPLSVDQVRLVPPPVAGMYQVPGTQYGNISAQPGERVLQPGGAVFEGAPKPMSETEAIGEQYRRMIESGALSDQLLLDRIMGDRAPVTVAAPDGPTYMSPGEAVRTGASAYEKPAAQSLDNYLAIGPNNDEKRFVGYVGPGGQIHDVATRQPVPNVVRKESTGGGLSFETDGQGGIKLATGNAAGNTTARVTDLQRQETEAGRATNELTALFDTLRPDDLGIEGNINELLTNYGSQMFPTLARPDVAGTRAQLKATTLGLARMLVQDERLSDADRRAANEVMVSGGLGESLPGAQAKLATLVALSAYRGKFANTVRTGRQALPPLDGAMLGRLVDEGVISPRVAQSYSANVLNRGGRRPGGPTPNAAQAAPPAPGGEPPVVNTPEEASRLPPGTVFQTPDGRRKVRP